MSHLNKKIFVNSEKRELSGASYRRVEAVHRKCRECPQRTCEALGSYKRFLKKVGMIKPLSVDGKEPGLGNNSATELEVSAR